MGKCEVCGLQTSKAEHKLCVRHYKEYMRFVELQKFIREQKNQKPPVSSKKAAADSR